MNEQQLAIWGKDIVLLTFPDPGKYEHDNYRHGRIEETQPATHILRPDEEASKLAPVLEWSPYMLECPLRLHPSKGR